MDTRKNANNNLLLSKEDLQDKLREMKRLIDEQKVLQTTLQAKQTLQPKANISS